MATYDGLSFNISADASEATETLDSFKKVLNNLKDSASGCKDVASALVSINNALKTLSSTQIDSEKLEKLSKVLSSFSNSSATAKNASKNLNSLRRALNQLNTISSMGFEKLTSNFENLKQSLSTMDDGTTAKLKDLATSLSMLSVSDLSGLGSALDATKTKTEETKKWWEYTADAIATATKKGLQFVGLDFKSMGKSLANIGTKFNGLIKSLGRIALYRAMRTVIKQITEGFTTGLSNCYQWALKTGNQFASSMNKISTATQYAQNSIGAMATPLINAVAPVIDALVDKFVSLINVINQVFAVLSGSGVWTKAIKQPKAYADAVSGAASSAKKAASLTVASFDELHLTDKSSDTSSSGGSGSSVDYSTMFEEANVDSQIAQWTQKLKDAINNADWETAGTMLGEKLNDIVNSVNWDGIGSKIGYYFNGALQTLYYFLDSFDFNNLAQKFMSMVNGALEQIDFSYIGGLLIKKTTILLDLLIGAIQGLDWGLVGQKIGEFFIGAFDEIGNWLDSYNWAQLGYDLYNDFMDMLTNIDWVGLIMSVAYAVGDICYSAVMFVGGILIGILEDLINLINLDGIIQCFKDGLSNFADYWGNHLNNVKNLGVSIWNGIKNTLSSVWNGIKTLSSNTWNGIKNTTTTIWNGIKNAILKPIQTAKSSIKNILDTIKGWFSNFKISIPSIKLPHFSIKPSGWNIGDLLHGSIPSLGISWYAQGGFPDDGELFVAREAGAEMVGSINGHTAVANNDQIVSAVSQGVYQAVLSAMSGDSNGNNINLTVTLDGETVFKNVVKHNNQKVKQTGSSPLLV